MHSFAEERVEDLHSFADDGIEALHSFAEERVEASHDNVMMYFGIIYKQELVGIRVFIASSVMGLTRVPF